MTHIISRHEKTISQQFSKSINVRYKGSVPVTDSYIYGLRASRTFILWYSTQVLLIMVPLLPGPLLAIPWELEIYHLIGKLLQGHWFPRMVSNIIAPTISRLVLLLIQFYRRIVVQNRWKRLRKNILSHNITPVTNWPSNITFRIYWGTPKQAVENS